MNPNITSSVSEYRRQLLAPDFDGFEAYFGCPALPELRQFYELKERLLAGVLYATINTEEGIVRFDLIQCAQPMTHMNWTARYGREFFRFATNTDGYPLLIKPALSRSPVFADWGNGQTTPDIEQLGFTLSEIVGSLSNDPS
jgi:hypothetical protein